MHYHGAVVGDRSSRVGGLARVVTHVLWSQGLEDEVGSEGRDVDHTDASKVGGGARGEGGCRCDQATVLEPLDGDRQVSLGDGAEDGVPLPLMQGSREGEGVDDGSDRD